MPAGQQRRDEVVHDGVLAHDAPADLLIVNPPRAGLEAGVPEVVMADPPGTIRTPSHRMKRRTGSVCLSKKAARSPSGTPPSVPAVGAITLLLGAVIGMAKDDLKKALGLGS